MSAITGLKDKATGGLESFFSLPDKHPKLRIVYDIAIIAIGLSAIVLGMYLSGGFTAASFSPSMQTFPVLGIGMLATGIGISWLSEDVFGTDSKLNVIGKIMAVAMPILFMGAVGAFGYLAFSGGATNAPLSPYFIPFILMAPGTFYTAGVAFERLDESSSKKGSKKESKPAITENKKLEKKKAEKLNKKQDSKLDESQRRLIPFYRGKGKSWEGNRDGWTLRQMQDYFANGGEGNASEKLKSHHLIQWLFPLQSKSNYNPYAPKLTDEQIVLFVTDDELKKEVKKSFEAMMAYYGLQYDADKRQVYFNHATWEKRKEHWLNPDDHNFKRISRIIGFLTTIGMRDEAYAFYDFLDGLSKNPDGIKANLSKNLDYWGDALGLN